MSCRASQQASIEELNTASLANLGGYENSSISGKVQSTSAHSVGLSLVMAQLSLVLSTLLGSKQPEHNRMPGYHLDWPMQLLFCAATAGHTMC